MDNHPVIPDNAPQGIGDPKPEARSDQSLGVWRVTDTTDPAIRKKSVAEFVLGPDAFEIRITDGLTVRVPYSVARYASVEGARKAAIYTQGGVIWVEAQGAVMPAELDRQLALRKPLAPVVAEQVPWGGGEPPPVLTRQPAVVLSLIAVILSAATFAAVIVRTEPAAVAPAASAHDYSDDLHSISQRLSSLETSLATLRQDTQGFDAVASEIDAINWKLEAACDRLVWMGSGVDFLSQRVGGRPAIPPGIPLNDCMEH